MCVTRLPYKNIRIWPYWHWWFISIYYDYLQSNHGVFLSAPIRQTLTKSRRKTDLWKCEYVLIDLRINCSHKCLSGQHTTRFKKRGQEMVHLTANISFKTIEGENRSNINKWGWGGGTSLATWRSQIRVLIGPLWRCLGPLCKELR